MTDLECIPYAAAHAAEGLCLLLKMGAYRVLLDCGLSDVSSLIEQSGQQPPADFVLCSHAHPDHAQGLLALHETYPQLPIYASEITTQLLPLNWPTVQSVPHFCRALPWQTPIEVRDGLSVELYPAGHLPGAAAFLLTYRAVNRTYTVFFTGDFFLSNSRLVQGLSLEPLRGMRPDVLIIEGSHGTARFPHRRQQENQLAERLDQAIAANQSILLPTPMLGLGQELLMLLRSHHLFTGRDIDIWVEERVAQGCDAYLDLLPHFPSSIQNFARHQPLFWDDRIRPCVRRLPDGQAELSPGKPCIVIAHQTADLASILQRQTGPWAILAAQRSQQVSADRMSDTKELLMLSQSRSSAKRLRSRLAKGRAKFDTYLLSDHCDGPGTTQLIHNLRPQHVVFVHGSPIYLADLAGLEELHNRYHLHMPAAGTLVELPIGDTFIQPAAPETVYEGELTEHIDHIAIALSSAVTRDPRWANLSDTGVLEARWQGDELVIRGLPQQELLQAEESFAISTDLECCENCAHYRSQTCWNPASPLFRFRVSPDGYCPAFQPLTDISPDDAVS